MRSMRRHIAAIAARQLRDSRVESCVIATGGAIARHDFRFVLDGDNGRDDVVHDVRVGQVRDGVAVDQVDGLIAALASASSLLTTQSKLAEDLEIWASSEFDYVTVADGFSRSSVLMPQKRNPYALSIIRGASGTLIGRLTGFLAVSKSPSARSDNLIYAYGEVPRAIELAIRTTQLSAGVRAFAADDYPHPGRPTVEVQQSGEVSKIGPLASLAIAVEGRHPNRLRDQVVEVGGVHGEGETDRVRHPAPGQPLRELLRAAGPVRADQHAASGPRVPVGELRESLFGDGDVIGGGVRTGVPRA